MLLIQQTRTKNFHKNVSQGCNFIKRLERFKKTHSLSITLNWPHEIILNLMKNFKFASRSHIQRVKEGTVPLNFSGYRAEKRLHNLGKALGEDLGLLKNYVLGRFFLKFME